MKLPQKSIDQSIRYFLHAHDHRFADIYSETGDMFQFCKLLDKIYYLEVIFNKRNYIICEGHELYFFGSKNYFLTCIVFQAMYDAVQC
eukprot:snap_masked-scaffold_95-processed-gene-0.5-mRNA-1 protein AED:1.00 eAED:1.00 QI:0/0/0/0/1/1/2/0/87